MDLATFEATFDRVRNWGRWGDHDDRGTLNHVTPAQVRAAARLVRDGITVSLAHDLDTVTGPDNSKPALHYMTRLADAGGGEPQVNMDFIGTDFHGKSVTHLDALCHVNYRGLLYNGVPAASALSSGGSAFGSVLTMADGIVSRGVLLDVARSRGIEWIEPGETIRRDELQQVAYIQGLQLSRADIVFVRTGARRRREARGAWNPNSYSAGLYPDVMEWLHENDVCILASDGDSDTRPSPVEKVESPIHALALAAMGMPLLDNVYLESLALTCERQNRWEFHCSIAPLRVPGGTGSPVNPIATF
ncbi:cyclase family protein [Nocardioides sp.]|uniref:cyclase family protein n=1 Tax=Nocardioides sp. TaxID=35761 RepID=UPI002635DABC|nr:cyclase family protein [Nocardioides sp.]MCW2738058.1 Cyclase [Nocardioides sp.]